MSYQPTARWIGQMARGAPSLPLLVGLSAVVQWLQLLVVAGAVFLLLDRGAVGFVGVVLGSVVLRVLLVVLRGRASALVKAAYMRRASKDFCRVSAVVGQSAESPEILFFRALIAVRDLVVEGGPGLVANGLAVVTIGPLAAVRLPLVLVPAVGLAWVGAVSGFILLGRVHSQTLAVATKEDKRVYAEVARLTRGHLEIVASGKARESAALFAVGAATWTRAQHRASLVGLTARWLPSAFAGAVAAFAWIYYHGAPIAPWAGAADLLVFGAVTSAVFGLGQGLVKARSDLAIVGAHLATTDAPIDPGWAPSPTAVVPDLSAAIVFDDVTYAYGESRAAVDHVALTWGPKEFLAVAGPNGVGKSTVLRLLLRLGDPTSGVVRIGATPLTNVDARAWRRAIGFVPQRSYLPINGTVGEALRSQLSEVSDLTLCTWLERVGVAGRLRTRFADPLLAPLHMLSSGEQQRVCLARVLAADRPILLLDEPEVNLDVQGVKQLAELLAELKQNHRILIAAHDSTLLAAADRVVWLGSSVTPGTGKVTS